MPRSHFRDRRSSLPSRCRNCGELTSLTLTLSHAARRAFSGSLSSSRNALRKAGSRKYALCSSFERSKIGAHARKERNGSGERSET